MTVDYRVGDVRDVMANIPDGTVDLVATSPPFLALRSYLPAGHEHKPAEIGSEPDPATFLDTLLALTAEWGCVLAPHGSIAIELGDTFAGTGTILAVADLHGRDAIGIDLDSRNALLYPQRYDEVKRALYGTPAPMPGQGDLFAEIA